jgi:hypothetical protein
MSAYLAFVFALLACASVKPASANLPLGYALPFAFQQSFPTVSVQPSASQTSGSIQWPAGNTRFNSSITTTSCNPTTDGIGCYLKFTALDAGTNGFYIGMTTLDHIRAPFQPNGDFNTIPDGGFGYNGFVAYRGSTYQFSAYQPNSVPLNTTFELRIYGKSNLVKYYIGNQLSQVAYAESNRDFRAGFLLYAASLPGAVSANVAIYDFEFGVIGHVSKPKSLGLAAGGSIPYTLIQNNYASLGSYQLDDPVRLNAEGSSGFVVGFPFFNFGESSPAPDYVQVTFPTGLNVITSVLVQGSSCLQPNAIYNFTLACSTTVDPSQLSINPSANDAEFNIVRDSTTGNAQLFQAYDANTLSSVTPVKDGPYNTTIQYIGCFLDQHTDNNNLRFLTFAVFSSNSSMTVEWCALYAANYAAAIDVKIIYMGLSNGYECRAAYSLSDHNLFFDLALSPGCNIPCPGNAKETCGGYNIAQVYKFTANGSPALANPPPAPASTGVGLVATNFPVDGYGTCTYQPVQPIRVVLPTPITCSAVRFYGYSGTFPGARTRLDYEGYPAYQNVGAALGMESGAITDSQITASSCDYCRFNNYRPYDARFNKVSTLGQDGWIGVVGDYIQVAFNQTTYISGISFQTKYAPNPLNAKSVQIQYAVQYDSSRQPADSYITENSQDDKFTMIMNWDASPVIVKTYPLWCWGCLYTNAPGDTSTPNSTILLDVKVQAIRIYIASCNTVCFTKFELYGSPVPFVPEYIPPNPVPTPSHAPGTTVAPTTAVISVKESGSSDPLPLWGTIALAVCGLLVGMMLVVCVSLYCFMEQCRDYVARKYQDMQDSLEAETDETEETQEEGATN